MKRHRAKRSFAVVQSRGNRILDLIQGKGFIGIANLARELNVSEMTIRRDLERMEAEGLVRRTPGGAMAESRTRAGIEFSARQRVNPAEKERIGRLAAGLVQEGQTIYLDAGTTVFAMIQYLKHFQRLQIVTNSLPIQAKLVEISDLDVFLVGGQVLKLTVSLVGTLAVDNLSNLRFDQVFLGTSGIDVDRGLAHDSMEEIPVKRAAAAAGAKVIVLADHSKFRRNAFSLFLPIEKIDVIVTDRPIEGAESRLTEANARLKILWPKSANE
jgi:DeoR family transcriptional regulator, fructose operon transcriptional repressor